MDQANQSNNTVATETGKTDALITEWKRRKAEDENEFLREIKTPEHKQKIEAIRGKIVNSDTVAG